MGLPKNFSLSKPPIGLLLYVLEWVFVPEPSIEHTMGKQKVRDTFALKLFVGPGAGPLP
jgi:hypothetical protein